MAMLDIFFIAEFGCFWKRKQGDNPLNMFLVAKKKQARLPTIYQRRINYYESD